MDSLLARRIANANRADPENSGPGQHPTGPTESAV
jgi:hypothetical protein